MTGKGCALGAQVRTTSPSGRMVAKAGKLRAALVVVLVVDSGQRRSRSGKSGCVWSSTPRNPSLASKGASLARAASMLP